MSLNAEGNPEIVAWDGKGWSFAPGVDMAEFMAAIPASPSFLDKIGVPADDPYRNAPVEMPDVCAFR